MSALNNSKSPSFASNVLTLVTGTTIAQIITILASPIITRLYGPEAFGLVALFMSITSIIGVISCFRYELAIMLPETDEEAANVFGLCMIIVVLISVASIPVVFLIQEPLIVFLKAPQLGSFFWLIPPTLLFSGTFLGLNYWNTRTKHFHRLSVARVVSACATTGTQLGFGFAGLATSGVLIWANVLGHIVSTLTLGIQILKYHVSFFRENISREGIKQALQRYSNFPKYDIWSALLNSISWQIPIFLLASFFSTTVVGYYSLGMMVIQFPMSFIGGAIAQVFYQRAAEAKNSGVLRPLVEDIFKILVILGLFPMIVLLLIGKDLFTVVFGSQWAISGIYVEILSIWAFVWFISSPLSTIVSVLEKQSWGLFLNLLIFSTRVISLVIGGILGDVVIALLLFSASGIIVYGYLCIKTMEYSGISIRNILKMILEKSSRVIPVGIILLLLVLLKITSIIIVIVACLSALIYYSYLIKDEPLLYDQFARMFIRHKKGN